MSGRTRGLLLLAWLLLTLPMIGLGYGSHGDCWRVAHATDYIWRTHHYATSRGASLGIGYPLYEIAVSPFVHYGGWVLSNLFSVAAGVMLLLALFRLARQNRLRHPVLVVLAIGFLPLFVKNASTTIDFVVGIAMLFWAICFTLDRRYAAAALILGLSTGVRHTTAIFILPCMIYAYLVERRISVPVRQLVIGVLAGIVAYAPFFLAYGVKVPGGLKFLGFYTHFVVGTYRMMEAYGIVQFVAVALGLGILLIGAIRKRSPVLRSPEFVLYGSIILLGLALFWLHPYKAEYLMPVAAVTLLLLDQLASRRLFLILTLLLLSYHVVRLDALGGESGRRGVVFSLKKGFTVSDISARRFIMSTREAATLYRTDRPTLLMMGASWIPILNDAWTRDEDLQVYRQKNGNLYVGGNVLDEAMLRELKARGFRLVVWGGSKWEYSRVKDFDWRSYVEVIDNLEDLFGVPLKGEATQVERGIVLWPRPQPAGAAG